MLCCVSYRIVSFHAVSHTLAGLRINVLTSTVGPGPGHDECGCPKGVLGDPCRHGKGVSHSRECKSSSSDNDNSNTNTNSDGSSSDYTTSSSTSSETDGYNGGDSSSSGNTASSNQKNDNIPEGAAMLNPNDFSFWMMAAAAVAAAFATGAVVMGQRKRKKSAHPLSGSVARRMGLFSNFADAALCNNGGQNMRPARVVEMTMSKEDYSMA